MNLNDVFQHKMQYVTSLNPFDSLVGQEGGEMMDYLIEILQ
jgi:hypothetical protein